MDCEGIEPWQLEFMHQWRTPTGRERVLRRAARLDKLLTRADLEALAECFRILEADPEAYSNRRRNLEYDLRVQDYNAYKKLKARCAMPTKAPKDISQCAVTEEKELRKTVQWIRALPLIQGWLLRDKHLDKLILVCSPFEFTSEQDSALATWRPHERVQLIGHFELDRPQDFDIVHSACLVPEGEDYRWLALERVLRGRSDEFQEAAFAFACPEVTLEQLRALFICAKLIDAQTSRVALVEGDAKLAGLLHRCLLHLCGALKVGMCQLSGQSVGAALGIPRHPIPLNW